MCSGKFPVFRVLRTFRVGPVRSMRSVLVPAGVVAFRESAAKKWGRSPLRKSGIGVKYRQSRWGSCGSVAQLVEQRGHNPLVGGSSPSAATG